MLTRPDPPKSDKIVTLPDPTRGSIRPVDNSVQAANLTNCIVGTRKALLRSRGLHSLKPFHVLVFGENGYVPIFPKVGTIYPKV